MTQTALTKSRNEEVDDRWVNIHSSLQRYSCLKKEKPKHDAVKSTTLIEFASKLDNQLNLISRKPQVITSRIFRAPTKKLPQQELFSYFRKKRF